MWIRRYNYGAATKWADVIISELNLHSRNLRYQISGNDFNIRLWRILPRTYRVDKLVRFLSTAYVGYGYVRRSDFFILVVRVKARLRYLSRNYGGGAGGINSEIVLTPRCYEDTR